ncbi:MAG: hypothetical protein K940chlam1_01071 [Candidatus Anoxychlamydiales bacterium]|nr:hypothetical protein [Candidatus Anoxychlamydiales bacterium]NGX35999.1 hypothetical protein [Candidatus Anoxychlamydiales bacterium]
MKLLRKTFLMLSVLVLISIFLHGRKQEAPTSLKKTAPKAIETKLSDPCLEEQQDICYDPGDQEAPKAAETKPGDPCLVEPQDTCCESDNQEEPKKAYNQGYAICGNDLPSAYSAPGRIDVCEGFDAFVTASFIYWEALGDQLDLGIVRFATLDPQEFEIIKLNTEYKPGFKVGLGANLAHDNWDLYAQYTRFHASTSTTFNPSGAPSNTFQTTYFMAGFNGFLFGDFNGGIKGVWSTDLDKIDLELARSFYLGTNLIFRPFIGGSVHWLDEKYDFNLSYQNIPFFGNFATDSWAVGPRFGLGSSWLFYEGFRVFGYGAYDLLFCSNETTGSGSENENSGHIPPTVNILSYTLNKDKQNILRDVTELSIGLGWGSYFCSNKWHFDFAILYEAQKYSHTNYMSRYAQTKSAVSNASIANVQVKPGDLFLHGLTLTTRFDF